MNKILERDYQPKVKRRIEEEFPGTIVIKMDPALQRGFPDLIALFPSGRWATLETKRSSNASKRPLQDWWHDCLDRMSFSRFICPENEEEVFYDLQQTFKP